MEVEGVIAASGIIDGPTPGGIPGGGSITGSTYCSPSDLEDMINDIFTYEP